MRSKRNARGPGRARAGCVVRNAAGRAALAERDLRPVSGRYRSVYTAYGLERSFWRSRSLGTRWFYFRAWLAGTPTHTSEGEDLSQLGGDFIVDPTGRLRLVHPSREPVDRPSVDQLFDVLGAIQAGHSS